MEMDVFTIFLKYGLLSTSILMSICDLLMISFGVTLTGSAEYKNGAYMTAIVGMIFITTGFIGTFAAIRESHILSVWFTVTGIISFVGTLIYVILYLCMKDDLFEATKERINYAWAHLEEQPDLMKKIQNYYMCCGKEGPADYLKDDDDILPSSCCSSYDCSKETNKFSDGCYEDAIETFEMRAEVLIYSLIGSLFFVATGVAFAHYYGKKLAEERKKDLAEIALNAKETS